MGFYLFVDPKSLTVDELLAFVEAEIAQGGWGRLDALNLIDWRKAQNAEAVRVGEALASLLGRGDELQPAQRARLLALIDGDKARAQIAGFLGRHKVEIQRLRKREVAYKGTVAATKSAKSAGAVRIWVFCPAEDAERVREFANERLRERGIKMPVRPRGRPRKKAADAGEGDELEPSDEDIASATKPFGS
jgi:hypothetical protein